MIAETTRGVRSAAGFRCELIEFGDASTPDEGSGLGPGVIWIAWERQRRTTELAGAFGVPLFRLLHGGSRWLRYPVLAVHTLGILLRRRPRVLIVQNPSLILALIAGLGRPLFRYRLVVDRHTNFALGQPASLRKTVFTAISDLTIRLADLTIVTNQPLAALVASKKGRAFVLPDRLPDLSAPPPERRPSGTRHVCLICTYAKDEPYEEVIRAASLLPPDVHLHVTGRHDRTRFSAPVADILAASPNIVLTGFLPEDRYVELLFGCDVIVDLTTLDHCLVCGAYEAIAAGKALVLSESTANRELFGEAPVYVGADHESIRAGLEAALADVDRRTAMIADLQGSYRSGWALRFRELQDRIRRWLEPEKES